MILLGLSRICPALQLADPVSVSREFWGRTYEIILSTCTYNIYAIKNRFATDHVTVNQAPPQRRHPR
jgi:hypothetical protein